MNNFKQSINNSNKAINNFKQQSKEFLYPIISDKNYNIDILKLTFEKTFTIQNEAIKSVSTVDLNDKNSNEDKQQATKVQNEILTYDFEKYDYEKAKEFHENFKKQFGYVGYVVNYKYDTIGEKSLRFMTHHMRILALTDSKFLNMSICDEFEKGKNNASLKLSLTEIVNVISNKIKNLNPTAKINTPFYNNNESMMVELKKKCIDKDTIICTTPIYIHKSKKNGGGVVKVENMKYDTIYDTLKSHLNYFPKKDPGEKNVAIFLDAKMTIGVEVMISITNNIYSANIKFVAHEIEIKYNTTYAKSILGNDIVYVKNNYNHDANNIDTLTF